MWRVDTVTTGLAGAPYYTRLYFDDQTGSPTDAVLAVVEFWENLASVIDNALTMTVDGIVYIVEETTGEITGTSSTTEGTVVLGTDAGLQTPEATQGLIQWRTGAYVAGRELRGRTFVPGVTTASVTAGQPSSAYQSALSSAANTLDNYTTPQLVIWSPTHGTFRATVGATPWTDFAVLRSRRG